MVGSPKVKSETELRLAMWAALSGRRSSDLAMPAVSQSDGAEKTVASAAEQRDGELVDAVKQMLDRLSSAPLREKYCDRCGYRMTHVSADFWLGGVRQTWTLPLAYCTNCNAEEVNRDNFAA